MRGELLFFRWLLVIALVAVAVLYAQSSREKREPPPYQTIPLIQGGKSSGLPLAGIVVDPKQRDVYAVVGGGSAATSHLGFFVLWKQKNGETAGTIFPSAESGEEKLCKLSPDGQVHLLQAIGESPEATASQDFRTADAEATLRSVFNVLAESSK
jgi:hypothetical protein